MKEPLKEGDKKTAWYENNAPVNEYLADNNSRKTGNPEKKPPADTLSWIDLIK